MNLFNYVWIIRNYMVLNSPGNCVSDAPLQPSFKIGLHTTYTLKKIITFKRNFSHCHSCFSDPSFQGENSDLCFTMLKTHMTV